jgi:arylsulfatase A-like enzyme
MIRFWPLALVAILLAGYLNFTKTGKWLARYVTAPAHKFSTQPADLPVCRGCNLILISLDTLRADHVGFNNPAVHYTPNLDRIAGQSLNFPTTYTNAFYTTPSHMTVFTSLYPHQHRVMGDDIHLPRGLHTDGSETVLDSKYKTLAEVLKAEGYNTHWAGPLKVKHLDFRLGFGRGFDSKEASLFEGTVSLTSDRKPHFHAKRLKELVQTQSPYFLFLHSYVSHLPYSIEGADTKTVTLDKNKLEKEFLEQIAKDPEKVVGKKDGKKKWPAEMMKICSRRATLPLCFKKYLSEERLTQAMGQFQMREALGISGAEIPLFVDGYARTVHALDEQVGDLWKTLEDSGALKNSVVIFMSDHGEELFEHLRSSHSSFFEHTARVVFMIYDPRRPEAQSNSRLVSLVDLMPTALQILGIEGPRKQMQGRSVFTPGKTRYVYGYALGNDYVTDGNWKLLTEYTGRQKLHYLPVDPSEQSNLNNSRFPPVKWAERRLERARDAFESGETPEL